MRRHRVQRGITKRLQRHARRLWRVQTLGPARGVSTCTVQAALAAWLLLFTEVPTYRHQAVVATHWPGRRNHAAAGLGGTVPGHRHLGLCEECAEVGVDGAEGRHRGGDGGRAGTRSANCRSAGVGT